MKMPILFFSMLSITLLSLVALSPAFGQPPAAQTDTEASKTAPVLIAGRSIADYQQQLDDTNRIVRLRAAKSLGAFGVGAGEALTMALDNKDRAVVYTAAVHLGRIGGEPLKAATEKLTALADNKDSLALRMAGSFALCKAGKIDERLGVLTDTLSYPDRGTACSAAELIGMLGADAKAAIKPLQAASEKHKPGTKRGDYHIGGAANNALRKIRGE